jgi:hypothetical protein
MCSFDFVKCNKACKEIYDRIEKEKSKKLVLIGCLYNHLYMLFAIAKIGGI